MKLDIDNNYSYCSPGGIGVFISQVNLSGKIHLPEKVTNLAKGHKDLHSFFITAGKSPHRLRCLTKGKSTNYLIP